MPKPLDYFRRLAQPPAPVIKRAQVTTDPTSDAFTLGALITEDGELLIDEVGETLTTE